MTYPEAIHFLYGLRRFGTKLGLENVRRLASLVGNPQHRLRFVHVAGTNGKGSVCAMLESIYRTAGLRVGLFTSPHLVAFGERIQVDRQPIPEERVARLVADLVPLLEDFPAERHPTFFEVVTVLALRHFAQESCDLVLWETGMGGRLDATNIVHPLVSVITNVDLDHQHWLGSDLAAIAREKAGIIKVGIPLVTGVEQPEAWSVIEETAGQLGAPVIRVSGTPVDTPGWLEDEVRLAGFHQMRNATLACKVVQVLRQYWPVRQSALREGLNRVSWPGRLQAVDLPGGPKLLLDGAHNAGGFRALTEYLAGQKAWENAAWMVGFLEDKDRSAFWKLARPHCSRLALVPVRSMRSADPFQAGREATSALPGLSLSTHASAEEAWKALRSQPKVIVTGSIYLVGEVMSLLGLADEPAEPQLNEWGPAGTP